MTPTRTNRFRAAAGRTIRSRLGVVALAAKVNRLSLKLDNLDKRSSEDRPRLAAAEQELKRSRERNERLTRRSESALSRLETAERQLQVWRYMAWLERARPQSKRLISVITATRNRAERLERCIDSVLAQAHTEFELVVVDDGSEDATPDVLARCSDPRVRSVRIDHAGVCAARNRGLEEVSGSVVTYLDDDNLMDPLWLMAVANTFDRHPEVSVLYGARITDDRLKKGGRGRGGVGLPVLAFTPFDREKLEMGSLVDTNTLAHRHTHPEGRFDEDMSAYADWDLMLRLTRDGPPYELPAIACEYSTRAVDRLSAHHADIQREEVARVIAKHGLSTTAGAIRKLGVMLMPFFGTWPEWIDLYFETCRWNGAFDWIFFTDCGSPLNSPPPNVIIKQMSFSDFNDLYTARFPARRPLAHPYKLCDIRPAYGAIFQDYVLNYKFFGWGDLDVVYGDIASHLTADQLSAEVITFNRDHLSGHFTLVNTELADSVVRRFPDWEAKVDLTEYQHLDEPRTVPGLRVSATESFNTPLSPHIPWTSGRFEFPREWYWREGRLTNDLDEGASFSHLHFMHWKGGDWPRKCGNAQWENVRRVVNISPEQIPRGFRINENGFFPLVSAGPSYASQPS